MPHARPATTEPDPALHAYPNTVPVLHSACLLWTLLVKQDIYQMSSYCHSSAAVTDLLWLFMICGYLIIQEGPDLLHAASAMLE